nr:hypothetical protein BdHM001_14770 [Bdellovibrio sp. HM001]
MYEGGHLSFKSLIRCGDSIVLSLSFLLLLSGCSSEILSWNAKATEISGRLLDPISKSLSVKSEKVSASCAGANAKLYKIDSSGEVIQPELASSALSESAGYSFKIQGASGLEFKNGKFSTPLVVRIEGCGEILSRPVTGVQGQDVSQGSTLLGYLLDTDEKQKLASALVLHQDRMESVIKSVQGALTFDEAYQMLTTDAQAREFFKDILGVAPTILTEAAPQVLNLDVPSQGDELQAMTMSVNTGHWFPEYAVAYIWKLDNVQISTGPSLTYTTSANDQGTHTLSLYVGKDNGSGGLDLSKPYKILTKTIVIQNTVPAVAPELSLITASPTSTAAISVSINTGSGLVKCASFSKLALTVDEPAAPLDLARYDIACSQAGSQSLNVMLPTGDGNKVLRLWALDAGNNISTVASSVSVILEQDSPVVNLQNVASLIRGGGEQTISFTALDLGVGVENVVLEYAEDGMNFSELASYLNPVISSFNYVWSVPNQNTSAARLRVRAKDKAGNWSSVGSSVFKIDSLAPSLSLTSLNSGTYLGGSAQNITWSASDLHLAAKPIKIEYSANDGASWNTIVSDIENTGSYSWVLPFLNSTQVRVRVTAADQVGNVAQAQSAANFSIDSMAPSLPVLSLVSAEYSNSATVNLNLSSCTDIAKILISESLVQPASAASGWQSCVLMPSYVVSGEGRHTLQVWVQDAVGNVSASSVSVNMTLDTTSPLVSLTSLNSGSFRGGEEQKITWNASDLNLSATPIKLEYSSDNGSTWNVIVAGTSNSGTYNWIVPSINSTEVKVRVTLTDLANNNTSATSTGSLSIDSVAPSALSLTRVSASPNNSQNVDLAIANCSGDAVAMIFSESSALPDRSDANWEVCGGNKMFVVSGGDGNKTIYAWAKDSVGNVSPASTVTMGLDTTPPVVVLQSHNAGIFAGGKEQLILWTASDLNFGSNPMALEYSTDSGATWQLVQASLVNGANSCVVPGGGTGCVSWTPPNLDSNLVRLRLRANDLTGLSTAVTSAVNITFDSTPPTLLSMVVNDGDSYAGTPLVNAKVGVNDNFSTNVHVRFAETTESGECQGLFADNNWVVWGNATTAIPYTLSPVDAVKKICVWAKDEVGNISVFSPSVCTLGIDCDTISYQTGNPPVIVNLSLERTAGGSSVVVGDPLTVNWSVSDVEGLSNNPISIAYTTDNLTWKDLYTNLDTSTPSNITWFGSLSGNQTSASGTITNWTSPTSGFLRIKAVAKDQAGNLSITAFSQGLGLGNWSFYAGSTGRGDGGTATSAAISNSSYGNHNLAIDPVRGDIYVLDYGTGRIRKLDVKTGILDTFSVNASTNLSSTGEALPSVIRITGVNSLAFDKKGYMYVQDGNYNVYQLNLSAKTSRLYIKRGSVYDHTARWDNVSFSDGSKLVFDEDNSVYFFANCVNEFVANVKRPKRLFKLTQNSDGTPGNLSAIAGDCSNGNPVAGTAALSTPISSDAYDAVTATLEVMDRGNTIYFGHYGSSSYYKILNGIIRTTNLVGSGYKQISFNPVDQMLYYRDGNYLKKATVNTAGNGGEVSTIVAGAPYSSGCSKDGVNATLACIYNLSMVINGSGTLYFSDGPGGNANNRVRYIDGQGQIRTVIGSLPFYGDGGDKMLARGTFRGIYYKKASEANQAAFPAGLYFVDSSAMIFGYINPVTNKVEVLWGDQARTVYAETGVTISKDGDLGPPHMGGGGHSLTFDSNGLPWLRIGSLGYRIDSNRKAVRLQNSSSAFETAENGSDPRNTAMHYYGGISNLVLKGQGMFLIGGFPQVGYDPVGKIQYLDFSSNVVTRVMGGTTVTLSMGPTSSADITTPGGGVQNATFAPACMGSSNRCYLSYREDQDRLYFSEGNKLRYITNPDNPATSTLNTLFTVASGVIHNYIFSMDGKQIWYFKDNYGLYCKDISSGKSWCDNTTDYNTLKSIVGNFAAGANGMTWMDEDTILISPGTGSIYQFDLPTGP